MKPFKYIDIKKILLILLTSFLSICSFGQKLFPFELKGKWGYLNTEGNIVIKATYDYVDGFNKGYAVVAFHMLPCLIDIHEKRVIDTGAYQYISKYSEGLCSATDYKKQKLYLNNKGEKIISLPKDIYEARPFHNGLAVVSRKTDEVEKKFGVDISNLAYRFAFMNKKGEYLSDFIYEDADDMTEEVTRVRFKNKFGLFGKEGKEILKPVYESISPFNEGLAVIKDNNAYGYINNKGEVIIKPEFDYCTVFNEGLAAVVVKGEYGFIDRSGKIIIEAKYDEVKPFGEGMAAVRVGKKWGFINAKGETLMPPYYDNAAYFNEGLCPVMFKNKWGAINKEGKLILALEFDDIGIFEDGIAEVVYHNINLYADTKGNILPRLK